MIYAVKIRHTGTGLFRNKKGEFTTQGKTYTQLGHAKTSLLSAISDKRIYHCEFVCMHDNYTVENIPVASYIIDYLTRSSKPGQYGYEGDQKKIQEIIRYCKENNLGYKYSKVEQTDEIKGCPFCGANAEINKQNGYMSNGEKYNQYRISCSNKCVSTEYKRNNKEVKLIWNKRSY